MVGTEYDHYVDEVKFTRALPLSWLQSLPIGLPEECPASSAASGTGSRSFGQARRGKEKINLYKFFTDSDFLFYHLYTTIMLNESKRSDIRHLCHKETCSRQAKWHKVKEK